MDTGIVLDEAQRQVVDHDGGPLLVLGSPGHRQDHRAGRALGPTRHRARPSRTGSCSSSRPANARSRCATSSRSGSPRTAVLEVPVHTWHALAYHLVTRYYRRARLLAAPDPADDGGAVGRRPRPARTEEPRGVGTRTATTSCADAFVAEVADFCVRAGHRGLDDDDLARARGRTSGARRGRRVRDARTASTCAPDSLLDYAELVARCDATAHGRRRHPRGRAQAVLARARRRRAGARAGAAAAPAAAELRRTSCAQAIPTRRSRPSVAPTRRWLDRFVDAVAPTHERVVLETRSPLREADRRRRRAPHRARRQAHDPTTARRRSRAPGRIGRASTLRDDGRRDRSRRARDPRAHLCTAVPYDRMAILLAQPGTYGSPSKRVLRSLDVPYRTISRDGPCGRSRPCAPCSICAGSRCSTTRGRRPGEGRPVLRRCSDCHPYRVRELDRDARMRRGHDAVALLETTARRPPTSPSSARSATRRRANPDDPADATFARIFDTSAWCSDLGAAPCATIARPPHTSTR